MKFSLPVKLAVFVILLFAVVIAACLLWTPLQVRYYTAKLKSEDPKERVAGVDGLLAMGKTGKKTLLEYYKCGKEEMDFLAKYWLKPNEMIINNYTRRKSQFPIHMACMYGYGITVSLLSDKGIDINSKNRLGSTPLHYAASNGHKDIVDFILSKGVDVNVKDYERDTPLHFAAVNGQLDVAKFLISKGAGVNLATSDGNTPLHYASTGHSYDIIALRWARRTEYWSDLDGYLDVIKLLLDSGAELNAENTVGETPLDCAGLKQNSRLAELLRSHGGKTEDELEAEKSPPPK
ncbi:MAG: ankyrin repeat domain-containing protein [Planctomycetota bacterium]|jgi:hypothetical protein